MVMEAAGLRLVSVGGGAAALTHRPKLKALPAMRAAGVTHLVTLLSASEGAPAVGAAARAAGLAALSNLIAAGAHVAVHCSAGIHRTGMFGYALLRTCGLAHGAGQSSRSHSRRPFTSRL
jgi:hypothetical protein